MFVEELGAVPASGYTELLWNERQEESFMGLCRIAIPFEGVAPAEPALAESFLTGRWTRPGAVSPLVSITGVELEIQGNLVVIVLTTDPPLDDRHFVGVRMAKDLHAAMRHAHRHGPVAR